MNGITYPVAIKYVPKFEKQITYQSMCLDIKKDIILCTFPEIKRKSMLTSCS